MNYFENKIRITFNKYYILIQSEKLCELVGKLHGHPSIKGTALWPFVLIRYQDHPMNPIWINHERIHLRQQLECLFIPYVIFYYLEIYYFRIKGMNHLNAYLNSTFEQECYLNQADLDYLRSRSIFQFAHYFKTKKKITFLKDGGVGLS